jgi:hypothetical protein
LANLPFASRQRFAGAAEVFFSATATGDFATATATCVGHLMNLPFASLHCTLFVAAALVAAAFGAELALVARASAAIAQLAVRIISVSL